MYELKYATAHHEFDESISGLFRKLADSVNGIVDEHRAVVSVQISQLNLKDEPSLWTATLLVE